MKRIYKLIITHGDFYRELSLNDIRQDDSQDRNIKTTLPIDGGNIELNILCRGANCYLAPTQGVVFQSQTGAFSVDTNLRCGDSVHLVRAEGQEVLFRCEMALSATLSDNGERLNYNIGFDLHDEFSIGGGSDATVRITDSLLENDYIAFLYRDGRVFVKEFNARYGLFINGVRVYKMCEVKSYSFISIDGVQLYYKDGFIFTDKAYKVKVPDGWRIVQNDLSNNHLTYPKFNRSTRLQITVPDEDIEVLDPPEVPQKPGTNLLLTLLPSISMLVLTIVIRGFMSNSTSNYIIFSVCMMSIGVITSIISFINDRRNYKKSLVEREEAYNDYIQRKREEIRNCREEERTMLQEIYHDLSRDISAIRNFSTEMFDRMPNDPDFLKTYLGTGDVIANRQISYKKREQIEVGDSLSELPESLQNEYKFVSNAPVISDLRDSNAVGFIGETPYLYDMMKNITLDICTRHYYHDVQLFYIINTDLADKVTWLRWLPHVKNEELGVRNIVCSNESKTELLEHLYVIMTQRKQNKCKLPHIVVMALNDIGIKTHPISQFFEQSHEFGVTFIFFENNAEMLPEYCDELIRLYAENKGVLSYRKDSRKTFRFTYSTVDDAVASQAALRLAPVYCEEVGLENGLTKSMTFFEMLGIWNASELNLQQNWEQSDVSKSLVAPIGINAKQEIVYLDIHEKAHGPHGLVAGTTGSGKSELLQTYILSMAITYHPYEVGFVIIDFKGGGMANQFRNLPHLIGTITNIDGDEINRSLQSIKAELDKRQRLFAEQKVNQIDEYIQQYKAGKAKIPLPHLIIVVDEFAELKANQPEFMKELISASRIGRSLGIHLILATQKPAGQVNDQIWSNSRFKLCLKVQSQSDSNEVIKSPLAAEIKEPGRAYLQVGNNELFELFQSGYSGGPSNTESNSGTKYSIAEVSLWGKHSIVFQSSTKKKQIDVPSQLSAIVDFISDHCETTGIKPLQSICLPALEEHISFPNVLKESGGTYVADIGIFDDPSSQLQGNLGIDVSANNTFIVGSTQYGKTNLLLTIIRSLTSKLEPDDVNIYVIDFGSSILSGCKTFPHVGGVVTDREDEKLKNLFKLIHSEIDSRRDKIVSANVSSFAAYREAGYRDLPLIVLVVDNFTALREIYFGDEDLLLPICRDGLSVGISVVMANQNTQGVGYKYLSNFSKRIAFYCNDSSEYSTVIEKCWLRPKAVPGRGIVEADKKIYEFQCYRCFRGATETEVSSSMIRYSEKLAANYPDARARRIPEIPNVLTQSTFNEMFHEIKDKPYVVPLGIDYDSLNPVSINLLEAGAFGIIGKGTRECEAVLDGIVHQCQQRLFAEPAELYILDSFARNLYKYKGEGITVQYTIDVNKFVETVNDIRTELNRRLGLVNDNPDALDDLPLLLVIVSGTETVSAFSKNTAAIADYKEIIDKLSSLKVCFIFANLDNVSVPPAMEILKRLRESRNIAYFGSLKNYRFVEETSAVRRKYAKERSALDGYYYVDGEISKMKLISRSEE